jgi:hypothetical protein
MISFDLSRNFYKAFPGSERRPVWPAPNTPDKGPEAAKARAKTYSGNKKQTTRKLIVMRR